MYLLIRLFIYLLPSGVIRTKWIERFHIFKKSGANFYFCPRKIPADPKLIKFGDNVAVATDVLFINHDVSQKVFNHMRPDPLPKFFGCIEVGNNVFIGARATILPNVKICDNVFIAAGALVTKSIQEPGVWGGVPAKRIGSIDALIEKRIAYREQIYSDQENDFLEKLWNDFNHHVSETNR